MRLGRKSLLVKWLARDHRLPETLLSLASRPWFFTASAWQAMCPNAPLSDEGGPDMTVRPLPGAELLVRNDIAKYLFV